MTPCLKGNIGAINLPSQRPNLQVTGSRTWLKTCSLEGFETLKMMTSDPHFRRDSDMSIIHILLSLLYIISYLDNLDYLIISNGFLGKPCGN